MDLPYSTPIVSDNADEACLRKLLTREWIHLVCNKLVRKEMMIACDDLFDEHIIDEDLLWAYLIFLHARKVIIAPKVTYIYDDTPGSIMNTSDQRIAHIINSRITICEKLLDTPPRMSAKEFFVYTFYVLMRAVNLYENNCGTMAELKDRLYTVRNELLRRVWRKHYFLLYLFFLSSVKPFYYVYHIKFFRHHYDNIARKVTNMSGCLNHPHHH